jgi:hypothetical protein
VREGGTEPWLCRTSAFSLINRLGNWVVVTFFFFKVICKPTIAGHKAQGHWLVGSITQKQEDSRAVVLDTEIAYIVPKDSKCAVC